MKLWKIRYTDDLYYIGDNIEWFKNKKDANDRHKSLLSEHGAELVISIDAEIIPKNKDEFLLWIRTNIQTNNG